MSLAYRCRVRLRFLLRPGWLGLTLAVVVFAVACFAVLAPWQFGRHADRKATNDAISRSFTAAPVPVSSLAPSSGNEWRTVSLTGTFVADKEVAARLRTVEGTAAFEILTPFRLTDGTVVLVDRGYVRPVQGRQELTLPSYAAPPSGTQELAGRLRVDERDPRGRAALPGSTTQVYAVGAPVVTRATGVELRPGYVQLTERSPGVLGALPLPELDSGPFLSYALQWITFGAMALLAWLYFTWREIKPGGALATPRATGRPKRVSVAQQIAEEEAQERADAQARESADQTS